MDKLKTTTIRFPADIKQFLEVEAKINCSSQNSEIVRAIRERMERKGAAEGATSPRRDHSNVEFAE